MDHLGAVVPFTLALPEFFIHINLQMINHFHLNILKLLPYTTFDMEAFPYKIKTRIGITKCRTCWELR